MTMRYIVGLSLAAAVSMPLLAQAQDFSPTGERILSDPTYLPLQGQFFGETGYGYERTNGNLFDATGAQTATTRNTLNTVQQKFAYGITDQLSVNAGIAYGFEGHASVDGSSTSNRSGFDNPTFGATYRLLDQRHRPVSLDIFGEYAPDAFQARSATNNQDGTVARGGSEAAFGLALGRETRFFTIRGAFTDRYFGDSSFLNATTGGSGDTSSFWVPTLGVQTQTRFTDRLSANVGFDYNFEGTRNSVNTISGVERTDHVGDNQNVNVSLNYHFVPNRLVGSIDYQHTFYGHSNESFPADPNENTLLTRSSDGVGATLRYVFK